jgi:hypothetical protein
MLGDTQKASAMIAEAVRSAPTDITALRSRPSRARKIP